MIQLPLRAKGALVAAAALFLVPITALADGGREVQVAGRTLSFLDNGPTGKVVFAIVFDPSKPASVAEKDEVMAAIGSGMSAGSATIVGRAVELNNLGSAGDAGAFYLTHGVNYTAAGAFAKSKKILSISSDMTCVQSGACVMGVAASPKVEIVVNSATAQASGISFKAAFKMMIKEI
jgi:hypothetical protein